MPLRDESHGRGYYLRFFNIVNENVTLCFHWEIILWNSLLRSLWVHDPDMLSFCAILMCEIVEHYPRDIRYPYFSFIDLLLQTL